MKKIAINCRTLNKRHGGPKRFLLNLLLNLAKVDLQNEYIIILDKKLSFSLSLPGNFKIVVLKTKSRLIYEYIKLPFFVNRLKPDIYIVPDPCFSPLIKTKKIAIYHDIIYFEKDQKREFKFFDNLHHKIMIPLCGKRANLNICDSNFTQARVKELLGFKNTKVIYLGVEESFRPHPSNNFSDKILKKYNITKPFIFYIGSMSPRKNVERMISSFLLIKNEISHNLYLLGGYSWKDAKIRKILEKDEVKDRVKKIGYIDEADLPIIYSLADVFLYPSLYEGFGLPILESQACACPVITSNIGAMKEIAGDGAMLINPFDEKNISLAIKNLTSNSALRLEIIERGKKNLDRFSWLNFAKELIAQYEKI